MALNFNIPMPELPGNALMKGVQTGGNLFQQMMDPVLRRENMQNQRGMQEAQLAQQWKAHLDNLSLQKQQEARLGSLLPFQRREAELKLANLERLQDPEKMKEYLRKWQSAGSFMGSPGSQGSSGSPQNYQEPMIDVGGNQIPLSTAQILSGAGAPIPGLKDSLKSFYDVQKAKGIAEEKERVKRQSELGDKFSDVQSGLEQLGRINQIMENYEKEAKDLGYSPRYGMGAELRTDPNALHRVAGRGIQRFAHPLEAITHPLDAFEALGAQAGSKVHEKYLSQLRGELNNLVNTQAKNLNSRFTQKEYEVLLANKPSISDSQDVLSGKLKAIDNAIKSGMTKLQAQNSLLSQSTPGKEPFQAEQLMPSEQVGRDVAGNYQGVQEQPFVDPKNPAYEYFQKGGKFYRRKKG